MIKVPGPTPAGSVTVPFDVVVAEGNVTDCGDMAHVVFAGPPLQASVTVPANPFRPCQ